MSTDPELFRHRINEVLVDAENMISAKNADYSRGSVNPFAAFDETAAALGLSRIEVWAVFYMKHVQALLRWIATGRLDSETIESRIVDLIAYPAILYAMIKEGNEVAT